MTYTQAKRLHVGDTVLVGNRYIASTVMEIQHNEEHREIFLRLLDGHLYHHNAVYSQMPTEKIAQRLIADKSTRVRIDYNNELGSSDWRYSIVVEDSDGFWLDSFATEAEAKKYIDDHNLKMVGE